MRNYGHKSGMCVSHRNIKESEFIKPEPKIIKTTDKQIKETKTKAKRASRKKVATKKESE